MAYVQIPGSGLWLPGPVSEISAGTFSFGTSLLIDATGEKISALGNFYFAARSGTKDITKVHWMPGTVVSAGGSIVTLSLQDVITTGTLMVPDETQDQTEAITLSGVTTNTWKTGAALSANRTVAFGAALAVVWEFDGGGRLGADSLIVRTGVPAQQFYGVATMLKTSGSWAFNNGLPNVILECTDGTMASLDGGFVVSAFNTHSIASNTASADEYAMEFQVNFNCKVDAAAGLIILGSGTSADVIIYSGTTAIANATATIDPTRNSTTSSPRRFMVTFAAEITLTANTTYRLAVKPTTTTALSVYSFDVSSAGFLASHPGGTAYNYTTRVDLGSWAAATTTRRMMLGLRISSVDDGSATGRPEIRLGNL